MPDDLALLIADIYEAAGALRKSGEAIAAAEGQTQARWQLLSVVSEEALSVPQAARRLGVSRQAVQRVADLLVAGNLAQLRPNPDHRTSPLLDLTPRGRQTLERIAARARPSSAALSADLQPADIALMRALLQRLIANVHRLETATAPGCAR